MSDKATARLTPKELALTGAIAGSLLGDWYAVNLDIRCREDNPRMWDYRELCERAHRLLAYIRALEAENDCLRRLSRAFIDAETGEGGTPDLADPAGDCQRGDGDDQSRA